MKSLLATLASILVATSASAGWDPAIWPASNHVWSRSDQIVEIHSAINERWRVAYGSNWSDRVTDPGWWMRKAYVDDAIEALETLFLDGPTFVWLWCDTTVITNGSHEGWFDSVGTNIWTGSWSVPTWNHPTNALQSLLGTNDWPGATGGVSGWWLRASTIDALKAVIGAMRFIPIAIDSPNLSGWIYEGSGSSTGGYAAAISEAVDDADTSYAYFLSASDWPQNWAGGRIYEPDDPGDPINYSADFKQTYLVTAALVVAETIFTNSPMVHRVYFPGTTNKWSGEDYITEFDDLGSGLAFDSYKLCIETESNTSTIVSATVFNASATDIPWATNIVSHEDSAFGSAYTYGNSGWRITPRSEFDIPEIIYISEWLFDYAD